MSTSSRIQGRAVISAIAGLSLGLVLAGCGAPGASRETRTAEPISITIPDAPTTITIRANADQSALWEALAAGFEDAFPQVTVDLVTEDFTALQQNGPRYLTSEDAPDLLRFSAPGDAVADGLLRDLQPYADAYGWNDFPATQLNQWRIADDGLARGEGNLYGLGVGFALVGLYTNATALQDLGLSEPTTLDEMATAMEAAKDAGLTPLISSHGGLGMVLQGVMQSTAAEQVSDWVLGKPEATIVSPETEDATDTFVDWQERGFFAPDVLAVTDTDALSAFTAGEGLFYVTGSWMASAVDQMATEITPAFAVFPGATPDAEPTATSTPNNFVIPANADNADVAAAFLNWTSTAPLARDLLVSTAGLFPGGPINPAPSIDSNGVLAQAAVAFKEVSTADRLIAFLADASAGMLTATLQPQLDLLLDGQIDSMTFLNALQDGVTRERAR